MINISYTISIQRSPNKKAHLLQKNQSNINTYVCLFHMYSFYAQRIWKDLSSLSRTSILNGNYFYPPLRELKECLFVCY